MRRWRERSLTLVTRSLHSVAKVKSTTLLRVAMLGSVACGWGVFVSLFFFASHPSGRAFLQTLGVPVFFLVAGVCLLSSLVLSVVSLFRRDWFGVVGLLLLFLPGVPVILFLLSGSKGEM